MTFEEVLACTGVVVLLLFILWVYILSREHMQKKTEDMKVWVIEKFCFGEVHCDEVVMWEALNDWSKFCPCSVRECKLHPRCTQCRDPKWGWYNIMRAKYCERGNPNERPEIFITQILEARRARWDRQ